MSDRAGGDEIGAGEGVVTDVVQRDAPRELDFGSAGGDPDPLGGLGGREVVDQQMRGAGVERFEELFPGPYFDFDRQQRGVTRGVDRSADATRGGDVVVLDENRVV